VYVCVAGPGRVSRQVNTTLQRFIEVKEVEINFIGKTHCDGLT